MSRCVVYNNKKGNSTANATVILLKFIYLFMLYYYLHNRN